MFLLVPTSPEALLKSVVALGVLFSFPTLACGWTGLVLSDHGSSTLENDAQVLIEATVPVPVRNHGLEHTVLTTLEQNQRNGTLMALIEKVEQKSGIDIAAKLLEKDVQKIVTSCEVARCEESREVIELHLKWGTLSLLARELGKKGLRLADLEGFQFEADAQKVENSVNAWFSNHEALETLEYHRLVGTLNEFSDYYQRTRGVSLRAALTSRFESKWPRIFAFLPFIGGLLAEDSYGLARVSALFDFTKSAQEAYAESRAALMARDIFSERPTVADSIAATYVSLRTPTALALRTRYDYLIRRLIRRARALSWDRGEEHPMLFETAGCIDGFLQDPQGSQSQSNHDHDDHGN